MRLSLALGVCIAIMAELLSALAAVAANTPIIHDGPWRFTAVTDRLIRMEYDPAEVFVDDPTLAFLRNPPKGGWVNRTRGESGWSQLSTARVTLRYVSGSPPSAGSVEVASSDYRWTWGDHPSDGNLFGTLRTLDGMETADLNCSRHDAEDRFQQHCALGLVSRRGWAIVNDTGMPTWTDGWFAASRNSTDVYVFMHGLDFAGAMLDFFHASAPPPSLPRWAFGTLFTRWFDFDSDSAMRHVDEFESLSMPLDAWIFDMNWHLNGPWGSYTWNTNLFPKHQEMLAWFHERGLPVGFNSHDGEGIRTSEATYSEVCDVLKCARGEDIPLDLYNKTYAMAQEDVSIRALGNAHDRHGFDFSWVDWQFGERYRFKSTNIPNLNPTIVLDMLRFSAPQRHGENMRGIIVNRWGGLGAHRYPIGFTGDQTHTWKALAFLPYFTSTAANVAYNHWSHDTAGWQDDRADNYEFSVRWFQMSAWSPVLRIHGAGAGTCAMSRTCVRVLPWDIPSPFFSAIRQASQERDELVPYMYTAASQTASSGLALMRPMYYEDPSDETLYELDSQYLFGPDMVISPIAAPSLPESVGFGQALGAVQWHVYAPRSGRGWVDRLNGGFHSGEVVKGVYGIRDVPGLVRQGAILPLRPRFRGSSSLARARMSLSALEFRIIPASAFYTGGTLSGRGMAVDDDGVSLDYAMGNQTIFRCEYNFSGTGFDIAVSSSGDYHGPGAKTMLRFSFPQLPPLRVASAPAGASVTSNYDHALFGTVVTVEQLELAVGQQFRIEVDPAYIPSLPNFVGVLGRVRRARYIKEALDTENIEYGDARAHLASYVLASTHISPPFAAALPELWREAVAEVSKLLASDPILRSDSRRVRFIATMLAEDVGGSESHQWVLQSSVPSAFPV